MALDTVLVGESQESSVLNALKVAEMNHCWLLLENLHLATDSLLQDLLTHLREAASIKGTFISFLE